MNTEVFAYNSIKNRQEILTNSLYAYGLCSNQFTPHGDKTLSQLVNVMHSGLVYTLLHH